MGTLMGMCGLELVVRMVASVLGNGMWKIR